MMLSRLLLNPMNRQVYRVIDDVHRMHQMVMGGFPAGGPERARVDFGVLYRLEVDERSGRIALLVQSRVAPDWRGLPDGFLLALDGELDNPATRSLVPVMEGLGEGDVLAFRLRANVTKKVGTSEERPNGQRVPVRGDAGRRGWLERKGEAHGFVLVDGDGLRMTEESRSTGARDSKRITFSGVLYDGLLRVTSAEHLRGAVMAGIGPAKAFGFGLLSLAKPRG